MVPDGVNQSIGENDDDGDCPDGQVAFGDDDQPAIDQPDQDNFDTQKKHTRNYRSPIGTPFLQIL